MTTANVARIANDDDPPSHPDNWVQAHQALSRLARERALADAEEGRWLLAALRANAHLHLGFGSFGEYIERLFGYKPRSTQEKLRVAEALEELPAMARALETGTLSWSAARELTRVAVRDTERTWLAAADGKTVRQLEELVANKNPGDDPSTAHPPSVRRHVLRFEVAPETVALFREAMIELRRRTNSPLDDDSALLSMARHVLGGPSDSGRASYQIALSICPQCDSAQQQASGDLLPVGAEFAAMAHCDGQHLGHITTAAANQNAAHSDAHTNQRAHVGAHVGAHANARPTDTLAHAKQTVPPALRRAVLRRDHQRCRAPGCKNATFLDLHHIELRSEGGRNELENLITLCTVHHRAAHRGELSIEGTAAHLRFRHANGSEYGRAVNAQCLEAQSKLFSTLRGLGFREKQVRAVLEELQRRDDLREATSKQLLREALQRLTSPGVGSSSPALVGGSNARCRNARWQNTSSQLGSDACGSLLVWGRTHTTRKRATLRDSCPGVRGPDPIRDGRQYPHRQQVKHVNGYARDRPS